MNKKSLEAGWVTMSTEERQKRIEEVENWLLYRSTPSYFEDAAISMLQEIYRLREEIENLKSQDPKA